MSPVQAIIGNYAVPILEDKQVWGTSDETRTAYLDSQDVARMALAALRCACGPAALFMPQTPSLPSHLQTPHPCHGTFVPPPGSDIQHRKARSVALPSLFAPSIHCFSLMPTGCNDLMGSRQGDDCDADSTTWV